ncbi:hypothetical protein EJB05_15300, partial [Eragrostis curvula]
MKMRLETTVKLLAALAVATMAALVSPASGQAPPVAASCTTSLLTSFTPCFNFLTNSSNGAAPTADCCRSLAALMSASTGCACLILTGNVPLGVPVNRTLAAVSLPKACNSMSVPLQCRGTRALINRSSTGYQISDGQDDEMLIRALDLTVYVQRRLLRSQLRVPSRLLQAPACRPLCKNTVQLMREFSAPWILCAPATPVTLEPESPVDPTATAPVSQGQTRPALLPLSAGRASSHVSATAAFVLLLAAGAVLA